MSAHEASHLFSRRFPTLLAEAENRDGCGVVVFDNPRTFGGKQPLVCADERLFRFLWSGENL